MKFILILIAVFLFFACSDEPDDAPLVPLGGSESTVSLGGERVVNSVVRTNSKCEQELETVTCNVVIKQNNRVTWCGDSCRVCYNGKWSECGPSDPKLSKLCVTK